MKGVYRREGVDYSGLLGVIDGIIWEPRGTSSVWYWVAFALLLFILTPDPGLFLVTNRVAYSCNFCIVFSAKGGGPVLVNIVEWARSTLKPFSFADSGCILLTPTCLGVVVVVLLLILKFVPVLYFITLDSGRRLNPVAGLSL